MNSSFGAVILTLLLVLPVLLLLLSLPVGTGPNFLCNKNDLGVLVKSKGELCSPPPSIDESELLFVCGVNFVGLGLN